MACYFTRWRTAFAACVLSSSVAIAHAQQPAAELSLSDFGPVLAETAEADDYAAPEPRDEQGLLEGERSPAVQEAAGGELPLAGTPEADPAAAIELIRERYPDGAIKVERQMTQDTFGNYIRHGSWKMLDPQGTTIAQGHFSNNLRDGVWHRWHRRNESRLFSSFPFNQFQEPFISEATFKEGQLDGKWIIYDAQQRKVTEWEFADGERHGLSSWYYPTGKKMREMPYRKGALHGEVVEWHINGEATLREAYQDGRKIAAKTAFHPKSKVKQSEGMYLFAKIVPKTADDWWSATPAEFTQIGKDERHGTWTSWYPNGQKQMVGEYRNDVEVGRFTWWYQNGQKATEGEYQIGKPDGQWTWWHQNGQKATQGSYALGNPTGRWSGWDDTGRLTRAEDHSGRPSVAEGQTPRAAQGLEQPRPLLQ